MKKLFIGALAMMCFFFIGCHGVHIKSNIPGAYVYINDVKTDWVAPCKIRDKALGAGVHKIDVKADGYKTVTQSQSVNVYVAPASIIWSIVFPIPVLFFAIEGNFLRSKPKELCFLLERSSSFDQNLP